MKTERTKVERGKKWRKNKERLKKYKSRKGDKIKYCITSTENNWMQERKTGIRNIWMKKKLIEGN